MKASLQEFEKEIKIEIQDSYLSITSEGSQSIKYNGMFTKDFLSEKEEFFKYQSLLGIKDFFEQRINNKEYEILKDDQKLKLIIKYNNKILELIIPIEKQTLDENLTSNIITELINIKNENKEIKQRLAELEKKVSKLMNEDNEDLKGFEKTIIRNREEAEKITKWVCPHSERRVKLLYKATPEENSRYDFHRKCDNKGETVVLIETTKGRRFGGYTSLSWESNNTWKDDKQSFLFSLDNNKKYEAIISSNYKVYSGKDFGPWFGDCGCGFGLAYEKEFFIGNDTHRGYYDNEKAYSTTVDCELSGEKTFNISKMEVYQIIK